MACAKVLSPPPLGRNGPGRSRPGFFLESAARAPGCCLKHGRRSAIDLAGRWRSAPDGCSSLLLPSRSAKISIRRISPAGLNSGSGRSRIIKACLAVDRNRRSRNCANSPAFDPKSGRKSKKEHTLFRELESLAVQCYPHLRWGLDPKTGYIRFFGVFDPNLILDTSYVINSQ